MMDCVAAVELVPRAAPAVENKEANCQSNHLKMASKKTEMYISDCNNGKH